MAFDIVTAKQGKQHVTAEQQAMLHTGMLGKGRYRLDVLNGLACSITDPNTLTVDTGGLVVDGRWVVNELQTSFAIANGSQSAYRHDLAVLEIATDASTGITTIEEKVLQGASATTAAGAKDPAYDAGDLLDGLTAVVPIARIKLDGLTPTCEALLPSVADLKTISDQVEKLGDSVSQASISGSGWTCNRVGNVAILNIVKNCSISGDWGHGSIDTLPDGWRPIKQTVVPTSLQASSRNDVVLGVQPDGEIYIQGKGTSWREGWLFALAVYVID